MWNWNARRVGIVLAGACGISILAAQAIGTNGPVLGQTLGTTAPAGQVQMQTHEIAQSGSRIEEIRSAQGVVRAYAAPNGQVFGLAWQGLTAPNLQHLLGSYFTAFQAQAAAERQRRRGPLSIQVGALVVQTGGHVRDFRGRAYLTNAIPSNLTPAVVQ